jgi:hypothetical protein
MERRRVNALLSFLANRTGRVWFWYLNAQGHRRLYFGRVESLRINKPRALPDAGELVTVDEKVLGRVVSRRIRLTPSGYIVVNRIEH